VILARTKTRANPARAEVLLLNISTIVVFTYEDKAPATEVLESNLGAESRDHASARAVTPPTPLPIADSLFPMGPAPRMERAYDHLLRPLGIS
jgi:hypothetical protein